MASIGMIYCRSQLCRIGYSGVGSWIYSTGWNLHGVCCEPRSNPYQGGGVRRANGAEVSSIERLFPRLKTEAIDTLGRLKSMPLSEVRGKRTDRRDCHLPQLFVK